jgi:hypothetical protein
MMKAIWDWVCAEDYRTWIAHALVAVALALPLTVYAMVVFYLLRELEQVADKLMKGERLVPKDHFLDVWAPMAGLALLEIGRFLW